MELVEAGVELLDFDELVSDPDVLDPLLDDPESELPEVAVPESDDADVEEDEDDSPSFDDELLLLEDVDESRLSLR